jgi:hypothetical protein
MNEEVVKASRSSSRQARRHLDPGCRLPTEKEGEEAGDESKE